MKNNYKSISNFNKNNKFRCIYFPISFKIYFLSIFSTLLYLFSPQKYKLHPNYSTHPNTLQITIEHQ